MRKTFLQLYNEIFENDSLRNLQERILSVVGNITGHINNQTLYRRIQNETNDIRNVFDRFFNHSINLWVLFQDIDFFLENIQTDLMQLNLTSYSNEILQLRKYIIQITPDIKIASDIIQDKERDDSFTNNTISFNAGLLIDLIREIYILYEPSIGNEYRRDTLIEFRDRLINIYQSNNNRFNLNEFRDIVVNLIQFFSNTLKYIFQSNVNKKNNFLISKNVDGIMEIIDSMKFI